MVAYFSPMQPTQIVWFESAKNLSRGIGLGLNIYSLDGIIHMTRKRVNRSGMTLRLIKISQTV